MLYNVLPPLVFFVSLGGAILVVSRVVLRQRRQQLATDIKNHNFSSSRATDIANIIGPNHKSVQVIKNRLAHLGHQLTALWQRLRQIKPPRHPTFKLPTLNIRSHTNQLKQKTAGLTKRAFSRTKPQIPANPTKPSPSLRIVTQTKPIILIKPPAKKLTQRLRRKKPQSKSVLDQANQAIHNTQHQQAEDLLVPYLAQHPQDTRAYMLLGQAALAGRNYDEAIEIFEQVVNLNPNTTGCYAGLGQAAFQAGKFTKAIEALRRAHDAEPNNTTVIKQLLAIAKKMDNIPMQESLAEELAALKQ